MSAAPETPLVVARRDEVASGVVQLTLTQPPEAAGRPLPAWTPGAHIDLVLPNGLTRQYSLCGDPDDSSAWQIAVLREPNGRGGSAYVHDKLTAGTPITTRGPRNNFALEKAASYLFVAGGIGITPILPMLRAAHAAGADWQLLYGGRTRASMAFRDELTALGTDNGRVRICPEDETGLLDINGALETEARHVYCCGPEGLLAAVEHHCTARPDVSLHVERFKPREDFADAQSTAFEVHLRQSARTIVVPPETSILEAVEAAGVMVLSSCREGTCGTCETDVLEGTPEHRDSLLTEQDRAANETMLICVSRSRGPRLVLDL
ncbi:MAG: oxidoreductase [Streptomycetaceae bacterium]|nr:oxidoreductase [Streptomycetaceae bacterium]